MEAYLAISLINGKAERFKFNKEKCKDFNMSIGIGEEGVFNHEILPYVSRENALLTITDRYFDLGSKNNILFPCRNIISYWIEWELGEVYECK